MGSEIGGVSCSSAYTTITSTSTYTTITGTTAAITHAATTSTTNTATANTSTANSANASGSYTRTCFTHSSSSVTPLGVYEACRGVLFQQQWRDASVHKQVPLA
jgi:hypothetical protein